MLNGNPHHSIALPTGTGQKPNIIAPNPLRRATKERPDPDDAVTDNHTARLHTWAHRHSNPLPGKRQALHGKEELRP